MFEKISKKIGFTTTEIKVILFFAVVFIAGFIYKELFIAKNEAEYINYDYSEQDSLFNQYLKESSTNNDQSTIKNNIEIKREVLQLSSQEYDDVKYLPPLKEKSLNINTAGMEELVRLPGIGVKTAEKIIALRNDRGKIANLEELLDVKGIGEVKFNKIKKFLYIE